jgi:hypothetical protein
MVAGLGLLVAVVALWSARRLARKLDGLTQSYWELRYDYTRLRSQVPAVAPETEPSQSGTVNPATPPAAPSVSFVPLSSLKGKPE